MLPKSGLTRGLVPSLQHVTGPKLKSKSFATEKDLRIQELNILTRSQVQMQEGPSRPKRRRVSNRTGCRARIMFKYIGAAGYQVTTFIEKHNHSMSSVLARQFLKEIETSPVFTRSLYSTALKQILEHQNQTVYTKQEMCPAFAFDYEVDEDEQMSRLFWADPMSKRILLHLEMLYDMAMGMEPRIIVTDQDPAMKVAIPTVFKQARHRYCMWHIMCKVGEKVGPTLNKNEEFRNKLNLIVWTSSLEPPDFEKQWRELMEKYNLVEHNWFKTMFEARKHWIPAYFRDGFMGGLLRTTSRSESENYTYSRFTGPQSSLVEFMMNFDSALKLQRNTNAKLNSDNEGYNPDMKTPLGLKSTLQSSTPLLFSIKFRKKYVPPVANVWC
ncbi:PREDICTED: protein FAR1-RELATED SEQUENCE 1-like [Ipomoea nil]|uniref:protein FAR1-RELATED SEQUENCE 1-like n=1 Tax=Ipomoea nil TaxID=35883 RepID=UPI000901B70D|nr:PREDICTED: protein FAR1-RELATED SEQUENCE 1-like [Ipomoea nil]